MLDIFSLIRRIAPYYRTVLISGETGTGKEVIAKALHVSSPWARHPFIVCNCGGLVEGLIESELFGHLKGSFTGAVKDKTGLFEAAGEGTIFLDEIGELPLSFQTHLLRVLQDGEFRRVGSLTPSKARCRVIAATHKNLEIEVKDGRFREDLYFRVTPLIIKVPPLRERKDDLPLLCRFILDRFNKTTGKKVYGISRPAQSILMTHNWPGNIRELQNVLEQAGILTAESFIRHSDLPGYLMELPPGAPPIPMTLNEIEKRHIKMVLQLYNGNRSRSAEILGISRRALIRKIQKFEVS
jgi:transcriptional regulator with PAS, ATPase and Fis domain